MAPCATWRDGALEAAAELMSVDPLFWIVVTVQARMLGSVRHGARGQFRGTLRDLCAAIRTSGVGLLVIPAISDMTSNERPVRVATSCRHAADQEVSLMLCLTGNCAAGVVTV